MKRKLFLNFLLIWIADPVQLLFAQDRAISGIVRSENEGYLSGVIVSIKGTQLKTATDTYGVYRILVPQSASVLVFSALGYETVEQPTTANTMNVVLKRGNETLEEVVVVGYGTVKRSDLTGSVASVKGEDISAFAAANPLITLSGRAAGVQVKQSTGSPGENVSIRIRGTNSIQGDNEPLYIIDGVPSSPYILNNEDIQSIEILKDASATAIYGSRGANGVVIISTKGGKPGKTIVDFQSKDVYQSLRKKVPLLNAREYVEIYSLINPYFTEDLLKDIGDKGTDWQDFVFRTAPMRSYALSVSGGGPKTTFSVGGTFFDQKGIIRNSGFKRYSLRSRLNHEINNKISVDLTTILTYTNQNNQNSSGGRLGSTLMSSYLTAPPILKPFHEDGRIVNFETIFPYEQGVLQNPARFFDGTSDMSKIRQVSINGAVSYKIIEGVTFLSRGAVNSYDSRQDRFVSTLYALDAAATVNIVQQMSYLNENTLTLNKRFNSHSINIVGGFTYQGLVNTGLNGSGTGFLNDLLETHYLSSARVPGIPSSSYSKWGILSYIGRANYSYKDKILLTATMRADGSSKYTEGSKWGYFPSGAVAYKIKEESFFKNVSAINDLKIRASWGFTGSQAISPYATQSLLSAYSAVFSDEILRNALYPSNVYPYPLKWETTEQKDIGLDFSAFNNRFGLTIDYYIKDTRDLLNNVQLPTSTGYTNSIQNIGAIRNKGLELDARVKIFDKKVKWDLGGNISFNRIKVVKLHDGKDILTGVTNLNILKDNIVLLREGLPLGVFYGYLEDGYTEEGRVKYKDLDGVDGLSDGDKVILGDPNPDFIYGMNTRFSYKQFELSALVQGVYGNSLANLSKMTTSFEYSYMGNLNGDIYNNHYTPERPNAGYPKIQGGTPTIWFSDRFIEDGSYFRLQNIELAYTFKNLFSLLTSARIFVSGQNLLTITNYSWHDPEVNSKGGGNSVTQGIDHSTYPMAKSFTFGLQLKF